MTPQPKVAPEAGTHRGPTASASTGRSTRLTVATDDQAALHPAEERSQKPAAIPGQAPVPVGWIHRTDTGPGRSRRAPVTGGGRRGDVHVETTSLPGVL